MSAQFIILYAGAGVRVGSDYHIDLVDAEDATIYISQADAWYAAYKANLSPNRVEVQLRDSVLKPVKA